MLIRSRTREFCRCWLVKTLGQQRHEVRARDFFERSNKAASKWDRRFRRLTDLLCAARLRARYGERVRYMSLRDFVTDGGERWSKAETVGKRLSIVVVSYQQPIPLACLLES